MFQENDYIVTLDIGALSTDCARRNYCFKQRHKNPIIHPCVDLKGAKWNSNGCLKFDKSDALKDWRYATPQEIEEYDKLGKPFDVTKLIKQQNPQYEIY